MPDQKTFCFDGSCAAQQVSVRSNPRQYTPNVSAVYRKFLSLYDCVISKDGSRDSATDELLGLIALFSSLDAQEALTFEFMLKLCPDFEALGRIIEENSGERYKPRQKKAVDELSNFLRRITSAYRE
jgi:hypothetical protein